MIKITPHLLIRSALPLAAAGLIAYAVLNLDAPVEASAQLPAAPATAPAGQTSVVAGLGLIEPSSEVIAVSSELSGVVREVFVQPGRLVGAGDPLFRLDARALSASLDVALATARQAQASAAAVEARVPGLQAAAEGAAAGIAAAEAGVMTADGALTQARGRLAAAEAAAEQAQVALRDAGARLALFQNLADPGSASTDERDRARFAADAARAAADQAQAAVTEARGAVRSAEGGLADARARLVQARAQAATARSAVAEAAGSARASQAGAASAKAQSRAVATDLDRLIVRAPIAGEILRVNVRPGEFAAAGLSGTPPVAMGAVDPLHVRVQIDEEDVTRLLQGRPAEGTLRGDATRRIPLTFVRIEPQAQPKQNLSGGAERVDTRVVEVIYAFDRGDLPAFVGQQMDVFVPARPLPVQAATAPAGASR